MIPDDELTEWRASSVKTVKLLHTGRQPKYPLVKSDDIWKDLSKLCHHPRETQEREQAKIDLENLCNRAYELSLLLRETKTEYKWDQEIPIPSPQTSYHDHEIVGTTGPQIEEPHGIHRIVFGGVIRGDRATGRLKDGRTRLFQTCVVISEQLPPR